MRGRAAGTLESWAAVKKDMDRLEEWVDHSSNGQPYKIQQRQIQSPLLGNEERKYITARKMFLYEF